KKQLFPVSGWNARTVVGHDHPDQAVGAVELRFQDNETAPVHRLDGVVDKIDNHPPDLLGIQSDERDAGTGPLLDSNLAEQAVIQRQRLSDQLWQIARDRAR